MAMMVLPSLLTHSWEPSDRVRIVFLHAAAMILSATSEHALNFNWSGSQAKSFFVCRSKGIMQAGSLFLSLLGWLLTFLFR